MTDCLLKSVILKQPVYYMQKLPIHDVLPEIISQLGQHNRVVLQAAPGAGKTTVVPLALLNESWLNNKQILLLEPRRLAARNAASRMAFLLNEKVGLQVGYHIRQDKCYSKQTRILVVTEGILTRRLQSDPELINTALVIFDEFHERSLHADLSLALCLQSQQILREDLKILVMSATLNTRGISDLLDNAPVITSEGRSYAVDLHYLDKAVKTTNQYQDKHRQLLSMVFNAIKQFIEEQQGSCLVFLPGVKEINLLANQTSDYIKSRKLQHIIVAPLHSNLSKLEQDNAISSPAKNTRKIVLATNIAETSLTIDGIHCVIDSGLERISEYSPASGMNQLNTQRISQDASVQRSGRAGRLSTGHCYRMWTAQQHQRLRKHAIAEIMHSDLSSLMLELANWGIQQLDELAWMDTPPTGAVQQAVTLLQRLKAIDSKGKITLHGKDILTLGTHPRLAHMMLSAHTFGQGYHACLLASILTEKNLFLRGAQKTNDIQDQVSILHSFHTVRSKNNSNNDVDARQCQRILQTADAFSKRVSTVKQKKLQKNNIDKQLCGVLLAHAYPDRIAKQRSANQPEYLLSNGKGAVIPVHLQQHFAEYLVIADLNAMPGHTYQGKASILLAAEISPQQLQDYLPELIQQADSVQWNESLQRVEASQTVTIGKITLQQKQITPDSKEAIHQCLLAAIENHGLQSFHWSAQATRLKQRIQFINQQLKHNGESQNKQKNTAMPDFSDDNLLATLSEWLLPFLDRENSIKQCQKLDMYTLLLNQLSWEQQQLIDQLAPDTISVPSGSAIRIDYSDPLVPVLAVRLQEVFGLYETPSIFNGDCQLMMHLLSPARRPMQVTRDLHSFWETTYHQVKKELRGKYKRHYWPDDPFSAQATSKTKKQMNRKD